MKGSPSRGDARKGAIAQAALDVYLEHGFGVSVDEVAAAAGASKQTIYKFFGGREGLARAAMELELERVIGPMRDAASGTTDARERLAAFAASYQEVLFSDNCLAMYRFVIGAAREHPEFGAAFTTTVVEYVHGLAASLIGELRKTDAHRASAEADAFIGLLQGTELNRALAGIAPHPTALASLRERALHMIDQAQ